MEFDDIKQPLLKVDELKLEDFGLPGTLKVHSFTN